MASPARTPKPPYYAVIFTSIRTHGDDSYEEAAGRLLELARTMPGFLGVESARDRLGVTVSYWESVAAIRKWREHPDHVRAIANAATWYERFTTRVCLVERDNEYPEKKTD